MDNLARHLENMDKSVKPSKPLDSIFSSEWTEMKRDPGQAACQPYIFASGLPSMQYNDFREGRSIRPQRSNNDLIYLGKT